MAKSLIDRGSTHLVSDSATSTTIASFTPGANKVLILWGAGTFDTITSIVGHGTWSSISIGNSWNDGSFFVYALKSSGSPSASTVVINHGAGWHRFAGVIEVDDDGAGFPSAIADCFGTPDFVAAYFNDPIVLANTLGAFADAGNITLQLGTLAGGGSDFNFTAEAGWTGTVQNIGATNVQGGSAYKIGADTSPAMTADTSYKYGASLAVEIKFAAAGAYTLVADQGSYALTGQSAGALKGFLVSAAQGAYTLLGSTGLVDLTSAAAQGAYALTGQAASLVRAFGVAAAQGVLTLSGQAVSLLHAGASTPSAYPKWFPLVLAKHLPWLRNYAGLTAAAIAEADGAAGWAKRGVVTHIIYVDVHSVPGYPRPGYP